jgi:hypothetical protein
MPSDQEFLLYPLDTGEDPACLDCGTLMMVAGHEVRDTKPDSSPSDASGAGAPKSMSAMNEAQRARRCRRRVLCEQVRSKPMWLLADLGNVSLWTCCEFAADNERAGSVPRLFQ